MKVTWQKKKKKYLSFFTLEELENSANICRYYNLSNYTRNNKNIIEKI